MVKDIKSANLDVSFEHQSFFAFRRLIEGLEDERLSFKRFGWKQVLKWKFRHKFLWKSYWRIRWKFENKSFGKL
jgi:hypothetical protein